MATITERTDSKGQTTFQVKVRKAGYPTMSQTFLKREDAVAWGQEKELNIYKGTTVRTEAGASTTIAELLERYGREVTETKKGAAAEKFHLRALVPLGQYTVSTLSPLAVRQWRDKRLKDVSANTVIRQLGLLHHVIEHARKEWGISGGPNPVSDVTRPAAPSGRDRRLKEGEFEKLLEAISATSRNSAEYMEDAIILALETGMRQSEIVGLEWEHVDVSRRTIRLLTSKNGEGRGVPLSTRALAVLERRFKETGGTGLVFPGVTAEALKKGFIRLTRRAGVEGLRFHDLRHEAASRLFERGLGVMEVASVTGHKDLRMLKRYTHLDASRLAEKLG